jgi:hypothetical protein
MEDCNTVRPHSALGNLPPITYAQPSTPDVQRDGTLRYVESSIPLHHRANRAQINLELYPSLDERRASGQHISRPDQRPMIHARHKLGICRRRQKEQYP